MSVRILAADLVVAVVVGLVVLVLTTLVARLLRRRTPAPFLAVLLAAAVLVGTMSPGISPLAWAWIALLALVTGALLGSWGGSVLAAQDEVTRRQGRTRTVLTSAVALTAVGTSGWLAYPGDPGTAPEPERSGTADFDPSRVGDLAVRQFTYGSGRPSGPARYGADVDVVSGSVDASELLPQWRPDGIRTSVWGFDASALPLNATVWAPEGAGDLPLVLLLHGNAQHADSELGLGYLGEHLASRGFVVASIDQSFLNTGLVDRTGGLPQADRVRGWLVHEHLAQWSEWATAQDGPVPGVDLSRVVLIGHSRGGEAVTVAAAGLGAAAGVGDLPPVDLPDVDLSAVVTLAPSDGLIAQDPLRLSGVDYLTIAGTHDADVGSFAGSRQYQRVDPGPGGFKAAVLLHRGNHTQFNTRWGRHDAGAGLATRVLNTGVLLTPEQQQNATTGLVAAFLDASVRGADAARALLTEPLPDAAWLPPAQVRVANAGGDTVRVPLTDVTGPDAAGEVVPLPGRRGNTDDQVLWLRGPRSLQVQVPLSAVAAPVADPGTHVVVDVADGAPAEERPAPGEGGAAPTLRLSGVDASGGHVSCEPVAVRPTLNAQVGKLGLLVPLPPSEPFPETVRLPLGCLAEGGIELSLLESVQLVVEGAGAHGVYLDNIGIAD